MKFYKIKAILKVIMGMINLIRKPENTEAVFEISEGMLLYGSMQDTCRYIENNPEHRQVLNEKKLLPDPNLQELIKLPPGTIGREYAEHMKKYNLAVDFYRKVPPDSTGQFFILRMRQCHDIWHVIAGFDISHEGEIGLQAFQTAQTYHPLGVILMAGALIKVGFIDYSQLRSYMNVIAKGWVMGINSKPLFSVDWEKQWNTPLDDFRKAYNIQVTEATNAKAA